MKQKSYTAYETTKGSKAQRIPPKVRASLERKLEMRNDLITIASVMAKKPTFDALCKVFDLRPDVIPSWLYWGQMPPYYAADLTKRYELKRRALKKAGKPMPKEITLDRFAPYLFLPK